MFAYVRFNRYVLKDVTTYVKIRKFCGFLVAGLLILGTFPAGATAQTVPFTGDQHFTRTETFDLPVGTDVDYLTVGDGERVDAEDGVSLTFRIERASQKPTPISVMAANFGGEIDLRNATVTIESYGDGEFGRIDYAVVTGGGKIYLGDNTVIRAEAQPQQGSALVASANADTPGYISVGNNARLDGMVYGLYYAVVLAEQGSTVDIGENAVIRNTSTEYVTDESTTPRVAVMSMGNAIIHIGDGSRIETFSPSRGAYAVRAGNEFSDGNVTLGNNMTVITRGEESYALLVHGTTSTLTAGKVDVTTSGKDGYAVYATRGGTFTLGGDSTLRTTGELGFAIVSNANSKVTAGDRLAITTEGYQGIAVFANSGIVELGNDLKIVTTGDYANAIRSSGATAKITVGDNLAVDTRVGLGAYASVGGTLVIGDNATISVDNYWAVNASGAGSNITFGENLSVSTKRDQAHIIVANAGGTVLLKPNTTLAASGDELAGIYAASGGKVTFGDLRLSVIPSEKTMAIFASNGGSAVEGGGVLDITGAISVLGTTGASVNLRFDDGSKYTGATSVAGDMGVLNMTFAGENTRWSMTGDSSLTDLVLTDGVRHTVPSGQTLDTQNTRISGGATMELTGSLSAAETLAGEAGKDAGQLNIYGSEGTATVQNLGEADTRLDSKFFIDSTRRGVKSLDVGGTASMDNVPLEATVWGFAQLASDEYTLVDNSGGGTRTGTMNVTNDTLAAYEALEDADRIYLKRNPDLITDSWDDMTHCYGFETGSYRGMIEIRSDTDYGLLVGFNNLTGDLAPLLANYLNNGMADSNLRFSLADGDSLWLAGGSYLTDGYAYFAWDLTGFNRANNSDVSLRGFAIPEPETLVLLLLSVIGVVWSRKMEN